MRSNTDPFALLVAQEDQPHEIPNSWLWVEIGALSEVVGGGTPTSTKSSYFDGGTIPWVTPADMSGYSEMYISEGRRNITEEGLQNSSTRLLPKDTLLFSSRAPIGYVAIAKNPIATNQGFKSFPPTEAYLPHYGYWYLRSIKTLAESMASGTTFLELSGSKAAKLPFPLPPLVEQRRIVAQLDDAMQRVEASQARLEKLPRLLKQFRQAVLAAAVSGRLTEAWRAEHPQQETGADLLARIRAERRAQWEEKQLAKLKGKQLTINDNWKQKYEESVEPDTSELPELPEGWAWTGFPHVAALEPHALKAGPFGSALKKDYYTPTGYKIYGQEQVIKQDPYYGDYFIDEQRFESLSSCRVKPGDILISLVGTIGKALVLPFDILPGIINPRLVKLSLDKKTIVPEYAKIYIDSPSVKDYLQLVSHGGTMDVLNLSILKELPFPLPSFGEQQEIVRQVSHYFDLADSLENRFEQAAAMVEQLPQALLAKAFSGQLVPQDPDDEPASVLLDRLRNTSAPAKAKRVAKKPKSNLQLEFTMPQSLLEILTQHPDGISPEKLFSLAEFTDADVDTFYQELAKLQPQLAETKPTGEAAKTWPNTSTTLRLKTQADAN